MVGISYCLEGIRWGSCEGQRCQKVVPGGEDQEGGDGSQVFEEPAAGSHLLHRPAPQIFSEIADGMEGESEKVQGDEHRGKIDFAVAEVVFEMVAVVLQDIEAFILDLPARPAAGGQVDHRVGTDVEVGDEAVAVGDGAGGVDDLDHQPVDSHGLGVAAQRDVREPAVAIVEALAPALDLAAQRRQVDAGEIFLDRLMGRRLAHEQEVPARGPHRLADRLAGEVAQIDGVQPGVAPAVTLQPAARLSQSCLSCPSWGTMNSGSSGTTRLWPGATIVAGSMAWKYSVLSLPRLRWEQFGQWILSEQWNSVPSSAINTCPSRHRMASRPPHWSSSATRSVNIGWNMAGSMASSFARIWLSPGIFRI